MSCLDSHAALASFICGALAREQLASAARAKPAAARGHKKAGRGGGATKEERPSTERGAVAEAEQHPARGMPPKLLHDHDSDDAATKATPASIAKN